MRNATTDVMSWALAVALATMAACGGDDPDPQPDSGTPDPFELRGACPLDQHLGGFVVEVQQQFSIVDGDVKNGVIPVTVLEEVMREGDCTLLRKNNPFCDPACQAGDTCDFGGTCVPFPLKQDVGVVTITGLLDPIEMEPLEPSNDYFVTGLTHPVFEPDAEVRLTSTDGFYGELSLFGLGASVLEPVEPQLNVTEGEGLSLSWQPPDGVVDHKVHLRLNIDQHGNTPVSLECEFDDAGQGQVPQSVIDALVQFGVSGFPNATLTRRTVDSQQVSDGCVQLTVATPVPRDVRVTGHTPCNSTPECPGDQICDIPNQTCVDP